MFLSSCASSVDIYTFMFYLVVYGSNCILPSPTAVPIDVQCAESHFCVTKSMTVYTHSEDIFHYSFLLTFFHLFLIVYYSSHLFIPTLRQHI